MKVLRDGAEKATDNSFPLERRIEDFASGAEMQDFKARGGIVI